MATLGGDVPTLLDLIMSQNPDGSQAKVIQALSRATPLMQDAFWFTGNLEDAHEFVSEAALPSIAHRRINQGVDESKGEDEKITEPATLIEGRSEIDVSLAKRSGDTPAFRMKQDMKFVRRFRHTFEESIFYEDAATNPDRNHGLIPRLDSTTGEFGEQLILAEPFATVAGNDQASILLVVWGEDTTGCFSPKGEDMGIEIDDMGKQYVLDSNSKKFRAWVTNFAMAYGLAMFDARYFVRIANIDLSRLTEDFSVGADIAMRMMEALDLCEDPYLENGRARFYMHPTILGWLRRQLVHRQANWLETVMLNERPIAALEQVPIRSTRSLSLSEAPVQ